MTYATLAEAIKATGWPFNKGRRPYAVDVNGTTKFVITNSPGNAAQSVCKVETCSQKEIMDAMGELMRSRSGSSPPKDS